MRRFRSTPPILRGALALSSVGFSCGCVPADGDRPEISFDTVGSYTIVRNGPTGFWLPEERWSAQEVFRIGSPEGPEESLFTGPLTAVSVGPQGQIFALDQQFAEVRVFDGEGRFLRSFGRHGQGPGEMSAPTSVSWDRQGRLWIPEAFNGRYTVFDSGGTFIKTVPRAMHSVPRWLFPLAFLGDGTFIDLAPEGRQLHPVRVDTAGTSVDTLSGLRYPELPAALTGVPSAMLGEEMRQAARSFLPRLVWALAADGSFWTAASGEYRLIHRTPEGDTIRVVEATHRSPEFTDTESELISRACRGFRGDVSPSDFKKTIVHAIHPMDDGHLLVQIAGEMKAQTSILDVFDPEGRFLGEIDIGYPMQTNAMHAIRGDTLLAVTLGDLDVPYIVKTVLHRPGN